MFQFPGFALCFCRVTVLQTAGLSHSEIPGSMDICSYPGLIAAYHVLRRLREPRHPPCALSCFPTTPPSHAATPKESHAQGRPPILSAVFVLFCRFMSCDDWPLSHPPHKGETRVTVFLLQSCLCQHVKDLHSSRIIADWLRRSAILANLWRITDSNR